MIWSPPAVNARISQPSTEMRLKGKGRTTFYRSIWMCPKNLQHQSIAADWAHFEVLQLIAQHANRPSNNLVHCALSLAYWRNPRNPQVWLCLGSWFLGQYRTKISCAKTQTLPNLGISSTSVVDRWDRCKYQSSLNECLLICGEFSEAEKSSTICPPTTTIHDYCQWAPEAQSGLEPHPSLSGLVIKNMAN